MEELYKITLSGDETPIEGFASVTLQEAGEFLAANQEVYDEPNSCGDTVKYILVPLNAE
jgi:hypothetical protein